MMIEKGDKMKSPMSWRIVKNKKKLMFLLKRVGSFGRSSYDEII